MIIAQENNIYGDFAQVLIKDISKFKQPLKSLKSINQIRAANAIFTIVATEKLFSLFQIKVSFFLIFYNLFK